MDRAGEVDRPSYTDAAMDVCPTDIILAPAEHIWHLVTDPRELARWTGTKLVAAPARAMSPGDRLVFRAAVFDITFDVMAMQAPLRVTLDIALPFGIKNHEQIQITPIDANSCRTTFN
jgi:hypothetical protein